MVTRLALHDLEHAGAIVGRMSALGTAGALVGSFTAGYVFVAAMPVTAAVVGVGAALVVLGIVLLVRLRGWRGAGAAVTGLLAVALTGGSASVVAGTPCDVETVYYCARTVVDPDRRTGRSLYLDDLRHSYVDLADPTHLELAYTQTLGDVVDLLGRQHEGLQVLHIGGGGFTLPSYLAATQPASRSTVIEVDQGVVDLARAELGLVTGPAVEVRVADARTELAQLPDDAFDLVVGDAFGGLAVPWHLTTVEFVEELRRVLDHDGIYAANLIDRYPFDFLGAEVATLDHVFGHVALVAPIGTLAPGGAGNVISLASADALPLDAVARGLDHRPEDATPDEVLSGVDIDSLGPARVLTDDWAPVDQLLGL